MKAKKLYKNGGPITPDPRKKMSDMEIAKQNFLDSKTAERNAIKKYDPDALKQFDAELKRKGYKVIQKKKYAEGGVVPGKDDSWVGKGRQPNNPAASGEMTKQEYLEMLTWQEAVKALDQRGVSMVDQGQGKKILGQGNANVLDNNYELAIKKAKEYGVYDLARQDAVKQFNEWQRKQKQQ